MIAVPYFFVEINGQALIAGIFPAGGALRASGVKFSGSMIGGIYAVIVERFHKQSLGFWVVGVGAVAVGFGGNSPCQPFVID